MMTTAVSGTQAVTAGIQRSARGFCPGGRQARRWLSAPRVGATIGEDHLFSFGAIADIQYADKDVRESRALPGRKKYYRDSPNKVAEAGKVWSDPDGKISFVLNLGDIIDGRGNQESSLEDLEHILGKLDDVTAAPVWHVLGNHCLNVSRPVLQKKLGLEKAYYSRNMGQGWKLVVLDTNDLAVHSDHPKGAPQKLEATKYMKENSFKSERVQPWNGGIASEQKEWLAVQLQEAKDSNLRVIVACHHPFGSCSARESHMAWNAPEMEHMILSSGVVPLVLSGHDHPGGYSIKKSTHFITLPGVLEVAPGSNAHAIVHVSRSKILVQGYGVVPSRVIEFL